MRVCPNKDCRYQEDGNGQVSCPHCETLMLTDEEESRFKHPACKFCTFLGRHNEHDLYHCTQGGAMATVIARFGDGASDYLSGMRIELPGLVEARRRAKGRGLT